MTRNDRFQSEIQTLLGAASGSRSTFYDHAARVYETQESIPSFPLKILWELDSLCHLRCQHCWAATNTSVDKPSLDRQLEIADEIGTEGAIEVSFSGGEPLLSDRAEPLVKRLAEYDVSIQLLTNGELVDRERDWLLETLGPGDRVQVSVDGPPSVHETQRVGADFDALAAGVEALRDTAVELTANVTVTPINRDYLDATLAWCFDNGIESVSISPVFPAGDGADLWERQSPTDYLDALARVLPEYDTEGTVHLPVEFYRHLPDSLLEESPVEPVVRPEGGTTMLQIQANGDIYPGGGLSVPEYHNGNVADRDLTEAWHDETWDELRSGRDLRGTKCADCRRFRYCRGGSSRFTHRLFGTIHRPDPYCDHVPRGSERADTSTRSCAGRPAHTDGRGENV